MSGREERKRIEVVELNDGYNLIGFKLTYSDDVHTLIENNLKSKMFNVAMFHVWLACNESTPFFIKIKVSNVTKLLRNTCTPSKL